jgi:CheY-like chemotaxis protein
MARILVVDDKAENRDLLSYLLSYHGHAVTTATGGAEALRAAAADPPDLIVMDIAMPGMDGFTAIELMRAEGALDAVPIVAVSATGMISEKQARAAGFTSFYPMPIEPRDFVSKLEPCLRQRGSPEAGRGEPAVRAILDAEPGS